MPTLQLTKAAVNALKPSPERRSSTTTRRPKVSACGSHGAAQRLSSLNTVQTVADAACPRPASVSAPSGP
jgi:hypothetical protein